MNWRTHSVEFLYRCALGGFVALSLLAAGLALALTGSLAAAGTALATGLLLLLWFSLCFQGVQQKLADFTDELCGTLDRMMDGAQAPPFPKEEETLLARITHRLLRLYGVLDKTRRRAEGERADLQALLSDLSHQTKTPIANLKLLNDTLLSRPLEPEARTKFLQASRSQLDKLDFLIQTMLKTSRLETGLITLKKETAPLADTLAAALNGVLALAEQKAQTITVQCPDHLRLPHDSRWTGEALFNLLDNAVKYTPPGGRITVTVQPQEMYVKIAVTDTGRGIPEAEQGAIFRRFYREAAVHTTEGVGIGLFLARQIITRQEGYIQVTSQPGRGSTFAVFLPRR